MAIDVTRHKLMVWQGHLLWPSHRSSALGPARHSGVFGCIAARD